MRRQAVVLFSLFLPVSLIAADSSPSIRVFFSPHGDCTETIVKEINLAKKNIRIQAYSFTSKPIAKAVTDAHARGVSVTACLDKSNRSDRYSSATYLKNHGIPVWIDAEHAIAHSKVILIDDATIITGSFNFSKAAEESNLENLLVIKNSPDLVKEYLENWKTHKSHCKPYEGVATTQPGSPEIREPKVPTSRPSDAGTVFVTPNGKKYHVAGCQYLRDAGKPMSIEQAKAQGKTPCKVCHPPS